MRNSTSLSDHHLTAYSIENIKYELGCDLVLAIYENESLNIAFKTT